MILTLISEINKMAKKTYSKIEIGILAEAFGKSLLTIQRWIAKKDDKLTSDRAKKALIAHISQKGEQC